MQTLNRLFRLFATLSLLLLPVQPPVHAGALLLAGVSQTTVVGPAAPAITFVACAALTTDLTTYTFTAANVGTASAGRYTLVGIGGEDLLSVWGVSTVTVGGDSATELADEDGSDINNSAFYILANPVGAAEDIVVTLTEAVTNLVVCVWTVTDIDSAAYSYAVNNGATGNVPLPLDNFIAASGVGAGICITDNQSTTWTWTGFTERADAQPGEFGYSAADYTNDASADSPLTITCVTGTSGGKPSGTVVTFRATTPVDPSRTFVACTSDVTDATTYTFTSASISTAADNRVVAVGVLGEDSAITFGVASMTIGGTAATEIIDEDGTGIVDAAIYYLPVSSGTTATIAVTFTEAITGAVICVWALYDVKSLYPFSSIQDDDTAAGALILTHTTLTKGISVGVCTNSGVADSTTWAELVENTDTQNAEFDYSAADLVEDAGISAAATCDWTGANDASGAAAHWR